MMNQMEVESARKRVIEYVDRASIVLTESEKREIEIAELGLNRFEEIGLGLVVYVNTSRVCAKELVLFPHQICPEHWHPQVFDESGKEETFRCRWGQVYLYVPGTPAKSPKGKVPADKSEYFTVWHEIVLNPGDQYTLAPDTLHWFQGGHEGAVVSEFSTTSRDEFDLFTDPEIQRVAKAGE
jgi:D-lyxose ketol-isomerase